MIREFHAMGTAWWLEADATEESLIAAEQLVHEQERRFSRFRGDSRLMRLNRLRELRDREVAEVTSLALELRALTSGAFDPAVGSAVISAGYDRSFDQIEGPVVRGPAPTAPRVTVRGDIVRLVDDGCIDLGGIAKGWTADQAARLLRERGASAVVVDAGGDVLVSKQDGDHDLIGLGIEGYRVRLDHGAVATSSTLRRRWETVEGFAHHIIDPATLLPAAGRFVLASVVAPTAAIADALATALIADAQLALPAFAHTDAAALVLGDDGQCLVTEAMRPLLV
jgi:thiamine biosynthesis lipoprotein